MKLDTDYSPELLSNGSHPATIKDNCYLDLTDVPVLVCTNGAALVVVPVQKEEGDTDGIIPASAILAAKKIAPKASEIRLRANSHVEVPEALTLFERPTHKYPDWREVRTRATSPNGIRIALDPFKLLELVKAMGADGNGKRTEAVELRFNPEFTDAPTFTVRLDGSKAEGYLQGCRLSTFKE